MELVPAELGVRLRNARTVALLTGNGLALASGVPSVQDTRTGIWADSDIIDLATPQGFLRNPALVWDWYAYRRNQLAALQPSPAHYALVDLEQMIDQFLLITQTIDGLHWRAGSRDMLELHGNIERVRCFDCGHYTDTWSDDALVPPLCVRCGGMLRPDVAWLGEGLPRAALRRAYQAAERATVFISVGASAQVQPAASLPLIAKRSGAFVVEINPEETALTLLADLWLRAPIQEVLPALVRLLDPDGLHGEL